MSEVSNPQIVEDALEKGPQNSGKGVEKPADRSSPVKVIKERQPPPTAQPGDVLLALGLDKENLSANGRAKLAMLSRAVQSLRLTSGRKDAILSKILQLRAEQWELEDSRARIQNLSTRVQRRVQDLRQSMEELEQASQSAEQLQGTQMQELAEKWQKKARFEAKNGSYVEELAAMSAKLKKVGFTEELRHESLEGRYTALVAKQESIAALESRLEEYKGLPADAEALYDLHQAKYSELQEAQRKFDACVAELGG